jgi:hypothetical protein
MGYISENKNRAFTRDIVIQHLDDLLPTAVDWIKANLNPEDVFDKDDLIRWAADAMLEVRSK